MVPGCGSGELLDLELGSIVDYGAAGTWLKVPLGKLATERMVPPLSAVTHGALDEWVALRGMHRPRPHPRTGVLTDFLFTQHAPPGYTRLRNGLLTAAESTSLRRPCGGVLVVTPHQLRHTWLPS